MTYAQHTPGPWKVGVMQSYGKVAVDCMAGGISYHVAHVLGASDDEAGANARLVATAPELIECLEEAFSELMDIGLTNKAEKSSLEKKIEIVLAKARGTLLAKVA